MSDVTTIGSEQLYPPRRRKPKSAADVLKEAAKPFADKLGKPSDDEKEPAADAATPEKPRPGLTEEQLGEPVKLERYDPFASNLFGGF